MERVARHDGVALGLGLAVVQSDGLHGVVLARVLHHVGLDHRAVGADLRGGPVLDSGGVVLVHRDVEAHRNSLACSRGEVPGDGAVGLGATIADGAGHERGAIRDLVGNGDGGFSAGRVGMGDGVGKGVARLDYVAAMVVGSVHLDGLLGRRGHGHGARLDGRIVVHGHARGVGDARAVGLLDDLHLEGHGDGGVGSNLVVAVEGPGDGAATVVNNSRCTLGFDLRAASHVLGVGGHNVGDDHLGGLVERVLVFHGVGEHLARLRHAVVGCLGNGLLGLARSGHGVRVDNRAVLQGNSSRVLHLAEQLVGDLDLEGHGDGRASCQLAHVPRNGAFGLGAAVFSGHELGARGHGIGDGDLGRSTRGVGVFDRVSELVTRLHGGGIGCSLAVHGHGLVGLGVDVHETGHLQVAVGVVASLELLGGVAVHRGFGHGIGDRLAVDEARQVAELVMPHIARAGNGLRVGDTFGLVLNRLGIADLGHERDLNRARTRISSVVVVDPELLAGDGRGLGVVRVGEVVRHVAVLVRRGRERGAVVGHVVLGHGVVDLHTVLVLRQVDNGAGPLVSIAFDGAVLVELDRGNGARDLLAVGEQVEGGVIGPHAGGVAVVGPGLVDDDLDRLGRMRVGYGQAVVHVVLALVGRVASRDIALGLHHVVRVGVASFVLRSHVGQDGLPRPLLVGRTGQFDVLDLLLGDDRLVGTFRRHGRTTPELERDAFGPLAILVVAIGPELLDRDGGGRVDVRDNLAAEHDGLGVARRYAGLVHGVDHGSAVHVLLELCEAVGAIPGDCGGLAGVCAVGVELDGELVRTGARGVVVIDPNLGALDGGEFHLAAVGDHVRFFDSASAGDLAGGVALDRVLGHGVGDVPAILLGVEASEGVGPAVAVVRDGNTLGGGRELLALDDLAVGQQVHGDALGTEALGVAGVAPDLGHGDAADRDGTRIDNVSHLEAVDCCLVALGHVLLCHGVGNLTVGILGGHVLEGVGPLVALAAQRDGAVRGHLHVVGQQGKRDVLRTRCIGVVVVVPNLGHGDVGGFERIHETRRDLGVGVLAIGNAAGEGDALVARRHDLACGPSNLGTVDVARQLGRSVGPNVGGSLAGHGDGQRVLGAFGRVGRAIGQNLHGHARRAHAVLVAVVLPELLAGKRYGLGAVAVGDRLGHVAVGVDLAVAVDGAVVVNRPLDHLVYNLGAIGVEARQVGPATGPSAGLLVFGHGQRVRALGSDLHAIGIEVELDLLGTQTCRIVAIAPRLVDRHLNGADHAREGVDDSSGVAHGHVLGRVPLDRGLPDGVRNLVAVGIVLRQVGEAELPVTGFVDGGGLARHGRRLGAVDGAHEVHGDARILDGRGVRVVVVIPDLGARNRHGLDVGVGDDALVQGAIGHGLVAVVGVRGRVAVGHVLLRGVGDGLAGGLVGGGQASPRHGKVVAGGARGDGLVLALDERPVLAARKLLVQVQRDGRRLVGLHVLPCLGRSEGASRGLISIGNGEAVRRITGDGGRVVLDLVLGNGVDDGLTVLEGVEVGPLNLERVAGGVGRDGLLGNLGAVGQQVQRNGRPVLGVAAAPDLLGLDRSLAGAGVGDGATTLFLHHAVALGHALLGDGPGNWSAGLVVLGQALNGAGPGAGGIRAGKRVLDGLNARGDRGLVGRGDDGDVVRARAVGVVVINPDLGDVGRGGLDGVDEARDLEVAVGIVAGLDLGGGIARRLSLGHAPCDLVRTIPLGQVGEAVVPHVVLAGAGVDDLGHSLKLVGLLVEHLVRLAVGKQVDGDTLRTHARGVVVVNPQLVTGDGHGVGALLVGECVGHVAVGINRAAARGGVEHVAVDVVLDHGVVDLEAVGVARQALVLDAVEDVGPGGIVRLLERAGSNLRAVGKQADGDFGRAFRLGVAGPCLGDGNIHRFGHMFVRERASGVARGGVDRAHVALELIAVGHVGLTHEVRELVALGVVLGQVLHVERPRAALGIALGVGRAGKDVGSIDLGLDLIRSLIGVVGGGAVGAAPELDRQSIRTLAILIALVIPDLIDGDVDGLVNVRHNRRIRRANRGLPVLHEIRGVRGEASTHVCLNILIVRRIVGVVRGTDNGRRVLGDLVDIGIGLVVEHRGLELTPPVALDVDMDILRRKVVDDALVLVVRVIDLGDAITGGGDILGQLLGDGVVEVAGHVARGRVERKVGNVIEDLAEGGETLVFGDYLICAVRGMGSRLGGHREGAVFAVKLSPLGLAGGGHRMGNLFAFGIVRGEAHGCDLELEVIGVGPLATLELLHHRRLRFGAALEGVGHANDQARIARFGDGREATRITREVHVVRRGDGAVPARGGLDHAVVDRVAPGVERGQVGEDLILGEILEAVVQVICILASRECDAVVFHRGVDPHNAFVGALGVGRIAIGDDAVNLCVVGLLQLERGVL